jgi:hypothetical protein
MNHLPEQIDTNLALWWGGGIACAWAAVWSLILYGLGRRDGANAKLLEIAEVGRLTDWVTERVREPVVDLGPRGRYRGHRRAPAPTGRERITGWRHATQPRLAVIALAMAGATTPLRDRYPPLAYVPPTNTHRVPARQRFVGIPVVAR